jgi:hypothetical protein
MVVLNCCYGFSEQYENLDSEHRGLFDGIFACAINPNDETALANLAKAVKDHFDNEEVFIT